MAISKRLRFEIFKRDGFRCTYCGATPLKSPLTVKLHADHVEPESKGGKTDAANLVTACEDCNLGKSDIPLGEKLPSKFSSEAEKEQAEQLREYLKYQRKILGSKKEAEAMVLERWEELLGEWHWQLPRYIPAAIKDVGLQETLNAVDIVARKGIDRDVEQVKYFCGIIRRVREGEPPPTKQQQPPSNPPRKPEDDPVIGEEKWKTAIDYLESYVKARLGLYEKPNLKDLIQATVGWTKERPAKIGVPRFYSFVDHFAWRHREYRTPEQKLEELKVALQATVDGDESVFDDLDTYVAFSYEHYADAVQGFKVNECTTLWMSKFGSVHDEEVFEALRQTIGDMLGSYLDIYLINSAIEKISETEAVWVPSRQLARFRKRVARWVKKYRDTDPSYPICKWPEFIEAPEPEKAEEAAG